MTIDCQGIKEYIYPFIDGQLDHSISLLVEGHLYGCPLCRLEVEQERNLDALIRRSIPKDKAPYSLREEIFRQIESWAERKNSRFFLPLLKPALITITGVFITFILFSVFNKPFPVFSEAVKGHIRFSQGNLPMGIVSAKAVEVSRWLQENLDFNVRAPDLSIQGAHLQGARVCILKDKRAAYLVYENSGHNLSVYMFEAKGLKFPKTKIVNVNNKIFYLAKEKGYNSALWIDGGIACIFVSDLNEVELLHLASL